MSGTFLTNLGHRLQKKLFIYLVKKVLGAWIKNPPQFDDINVLEEELNLTYLEFQTDAVDHYLEKYPFRILSAQIENLKVPSLTWDNIVNFRSDLSIGKISVTLLIEESPVKPQTSFLDLKKSMYQIEEELLKSAQEEVSSSGFDNGIESGIKNLSKCIRDLLYNVRLQVDQIEIKIQGDQDQEKSQEDSLILEINNFEIGQLSNLRSSDNQAWKHFKFNFRVLIGSKLLVSNLVQPITINLDIQTDHINVVIPKIKGSIEMSNLEKIFDLLTLYQEFSNFQCQSQMSFGMYFNSENDFRNFMENQSSTQETQPLFDFFQSKIDSIELSHLELEILSDVGEAHLLLELTNLRLRDLELDNTFTFKIFEVLDEVTTLVVDSMDFMIVTVNKIKEKDYFILVQVPEILVTFDFEIINRYVSYLNLKFPSGDPDPDPDSPKVLFKIQTKKVKVNLLIPNPNNPSKYYTNYLQIQSQSVAVNDDPMEVRFKEFDVYLVQDPNPGKIIYKSEFLRFALQKKQPETEGYQPNHPSLFSSGRTLVDSFGLYYQPADQAEFQSFNSNIYDKISLKFLILFGKTHLLIKEKIVMSYICQLVSGIASWKANFPPPVRSEYMILDFKWKEFFVILEDTFIIKLLCLSIQSSINFYTNEKFHYFRLEDGCVYNLKSQEVVLEKVDHRNPFLLVAAIEIDLLPKNDIKKVRMSFDFKCVKIYHRYEEKLWLIDLVDLFSEIGQFVPSTPTQTFQTIYISSPDIHFNIIINSTYHLHNHVKGLKVALRPTLQMICFESLTSSIFNQILSVQIANVKYLTYHYHQNQPILTIENLNLEYCYDSLVTIEKLIKLMTEDDQVLDNEKFQIETTIDINPAEQKEIEQLMKDAMSSVYVVQPDPISPTQSYTKIDQYFEFLDWVPVSSRNKQNQIEKTVDKGKIKLEVEIVRTRLTLFNGQDWSHQREPRNNLKILVDGIQIAQIEKDDQTLVEFQLDEMIVSGCLADDKSKTFFQKMPQISRRLNPYSSTRSRLNTSKSQPFQVKIITFKRNNDVSLHLSFFPARLDITQNLINFIMEFGQNYAGQKAIEIPFSPSKPLHFRSVKMDQIYFRVNYSSNLFDCKFQNHHWILNFISLRKLDLLIEPYAINSCSGVDHLIESLSDHYLEILSKQKQIKIIKSITPLRSVIRLANGVVNLVIIPSKECYKSGKIVRGLKNGFTNFRETTLDELRAIGYRTCDILSNTIEVFDSNTVTSDLQSPPQDGVIEIPYHDYNRGGILRAIQSYLKSS